MWTVYGERRSAATWASRSNRSRNEGSVRWGWSSLMATRVPSRRSTPRYTVPMPPAPNRLSTWKWDTTAGTLGQRGSFMSGISFQNNHRDIVRAAGAVRYLDQPLGHRAGFAGGQRRQDLLIAYRAVQAVGAE